MHPQRVVAGEHTRLGVYHDVLRRLRDAGAPEARAPDFADRLWAHFHRFNVRSRYLSATGVKNIPPSQVFEYYSF